ncbi:MAG: hypothetical protein JXA01_11160 [Dehalococcoidia bacterium]|nr:hypothetical protein [Dehalococcoidia bacterium]
MKAKWLMLGGAALFIISLAVHFIVKFFLHGDEAVAISLAIFVSPILILAGIAIYLMARFKNRSRP